MIRHPIAALAALAALALPSLGGAVVPEAVPNLPLLEAETSVGSIVTSDAEPVAPTPKTIDGNIVDWTGEGTRLGGMAIYSHGEYVYQNYLNSGWGADDGYDAERLGVDGALTAVEPRLYRVDPLQQAAGAQFGASRPLGADLHYGDVSADDDSRLEANVEEARVAADASALYVLVRTLEMSAPPKTAVLVLLDTEPGGSYTLPQSMGGVTTAAEWAFLASGNRMVAVTYKGAPIACGPSCSASFQVASNPAGYVNAVELSIARSFFDGSGGLPNPLPVGLAAGIIDAAGAGLAHVATGDARSDLVSVAFRAEPARIWMDQAQALALHAGTIDPWLVPIDVARLESGATETFQQRPGYYEAIYEDDASKANFEGMTDAYYQGVFQHYGVYLPSAYRPGGVYPAAFWMHYRGGHAHDAAAWEPGILREFGDEPGAVVVTPSARGESSWYTGRGMVDFLDVWNDVMARDRIDPDRVVLAGHSMGGWASYLLGLLMPDRWAAANPEDGLLVPGLWLAPGIAPSMPQENADLNAEFLYSIIDNARNLPYAILHGTEDELVPVSSAISSAARYQDLGYRYRLYLFHGYEHYSAPIWDDWRDVVRYMMRFRRDPDPAHVTYKVWPALDHAVSTISMPAGKDLGLRFDGAYWASGMRTRTPGLDPSNVGEIDAKTWGRGVPKDLMVPEAGALAQPEPYTMIGQRWLPNGVDAPQNRFEATLTNLSSATLDVARMGLGTPAPITASVVTDGASDLLLAGTWANAPEVTGASSASHAAGLLTLHFDAAGTYAVTITP